MARLPRPLVLLVALAAGGSSSAAQVVDLDAPGALTAMQASDPDRYRKVVGILDDAARLPKPVAEHLIRARYDVDDCAIGDLLMVSYPAKRSIAFRLEGESYRAVVTLRGAAPTLIPVERTPR